MWAENGRSDLKTVQGIVRSWVLPECNKMEWWKKSLCGVQGRLRSRKTKRVENLNTSQHLTPLCFQKISIFSNVYLMTLFKIFNSLKKWKVVLLHVTARYPENIVCILIIGLTPLHCFHSWLVVNECPARWLQLNWVVGKLRRLPKISNKSNRTTLTSHQKLTIVMWWKIFTWHRLHEASEKLI